MTAGTTHGIGEQWRHDLVAPLLYPWRERGKAAGE